MSKKHKRHQAPVAPAMDPELETLEGEEVDEMAEDVEEEVTVKKLTEEEKKERIHNLLVKLQEVKSSPTKNPAAQKKIRRGLRTLGFYISKEKEKVMEILLGQEVAEASATE